jgi:putative ABC transport system permease protein
MLLQTVRSTFRRMSRRPMYAMINLVGLSIGLAAALLIAVFVQHDLSYDRFHSESDRIHRIIGHYQSGDYSEDFSVSIGPLGPLVATELPEVEAMVRTHKVDAFTVTADGQDFNIDGAMYADPGFAEVFDFEILRGDLATALSEPDAIAITRDLAMKLFRTEDVIGRPLEQMGGQPFVVRAILENPPAASHLQFEALRPLDQWSHSALESWRGITVYTYLLVQPETDLDELTAKMQKLQTENSGGAWENLTLSLQPLHDVHLHSDFVDDNHVAGNPHTILGYTLIGTFILLLACVNFINLSTARATDRAHEVGMRKILGAGRGRLVVQFVGESTVLITLAFLVALVLVEMLLPAFGSVIQRDLELSQIPFNMLLAGVAGLYLITLFASSFAPALLMSSFRPIKTLKGSYQIIGKQFQRSAMVTFQFTVSIALLMAAFVINGQLNHMQNTEPGFDQHQLVAMKGSGHNHGDIDSFPTSMRDEFAALPGVTNATLSSNYPFSEAGRTVLLGEENQSTMEYWLMEIDEYFLQTYGLQTTNSEVPSDDLLHLPANQVLINETAAHALGFGNEAVGKTFELGSSDTEDGIVTVAGVLQDYHFAPVRQAIEPLIIQSGGGLNVLTIRMEPGRAEETMRRAEALWMKLGPDEAFNPQFIEQQIESSLLDERRLSALMSAFTILAVIIGGLGMFGLTAYSTQMRTREISIRKILGASPERLVVLLNLQFLRPVLIGGFVAMPASALIMSKWLENYAYPITIGWEFYAASGGVTLLTILLAIGTQSWRAASMKPADALRYE